MIAYLSIYLDPLRMTGALLRTLKRHQTRRKYTSITSVHVYVELLV